MSILIALLSLKDSKVLLADFESENIKYSSSEDKAVTDNESVNSVVRV